MLLRYQDLVAESRHFVSTLLIRPLCTPSMSPHSEASVHIRYWVFTSCSTFLSTSDGTFMNQDIIPPDHMPRTLSWSLLQHIAYSAHSPGAIPITNLPSFSTRRLFRARPQDSPCGYDHRNEVNQSRGHRRGNGRAVRLANENTENGRHKGSPRG